MFNEIKVKKALHRLKKGRLPFGYDLNVYRGCSHNCQYCYAMYSHKYLGSEDFFREVFVKTNIVEQLEKELRSRSWKRGVINLGGVCDSYQPIEAKYGLMRKILKVLIKYRAPFVISTKSNLILRDLDLIKELAKHTYVNVAVTITTVDETVRKKIEPGSPTSKDRFEILKAFSKTNASTGLHVMPILPYLTDSEINFDSLFQKAKEARVDYVLPGVLYLRAQTRKHFLGFIKNQFPELYPKYIALYQKGGPGKEYKDALYEMVNKLRAKHNLKKSYSSPMKKKLNTCDQNLNLYL